MNDKYVLTSMCTSGKPVNKNLVKLNCPIEHLLRQPGNGTGHPRLTMYGSSSKIILNFYMEAGFQTFIVVYLAQKNKILQQYVLFKLHVYPNKTYY